MLAANPYKTTNVYGEYRMTSHIIEIDQNNAQQVLVDESFQRIVLADFWADWCEPCKSLMPVLEKLANEYAGRFLLAKINADEHQMIASQLGVRSLPTVLVFKEGQPVDGFAGLQPESAIREMLNKYLPKSWDLDLEKAQQLIADNEIDQALVLLRQAVLDSNQQANICLALADVLIATNRLSEAEEVLAQIKMVDQDEIYKSLLAKLELAKESAVSPELTALQQQAENNPEDHHIHLQLAVQYNQSNMHEKALEILLNILRKDMNFEEGAAKKFYLDILATLGKGDPLAVQYQRKFYTLLY